MIGHVAVNNPFELRMGVVGNDALVKSISVIISVLLRRSRTVMRYGAASDFSAISNRWSVIPVESFRHPEILIEVVVHAEFQISGV